VTDDLGLSLSGLDPSTPTLIGSPRKLPPHPSYDEDEFEPAVVNDRLISVVAFGFVVLIMVNLICVPILAASWLFIHLFR
jgi:hypothetical protein